MSKREWISCKSYFINENGAWCCAYCGLPIEEHFKTYNGELKNVDFHKEHVIHNGADDLSNCIPSCQSCNCQKWEFQLEEWYNESNPNFTQERLNKIYKWLQFDYKLYIEEHKSRKEYTKKDIN
jgi:hypothetical protein